MYALPSAGSTFLPNTPADKLPCTKRASGLFCELSAVAVLEVGAGDVVDVLDI